MTPFRPLLTILLLSFFITTSVIAQTGSWPGNIVFSPSNVHANEAFDITASGWFGYANSVSSYQTAITGGNITIDVFARNFEIGLTVMTPWQVTAHVPPLGTGNYLVRVVMHGNNELTHIEQTASISISGTTNSIPGATNSTCPLKITSLKFNSTQTTNQTPALSLTFDGNTTSKYIVQSSTDLLNWTNEVVSLQPTNSTYSTPLPLIDRKRFYRVIEDASP